MLPLAYAMDRVARAKDQIDPIRALSDEYLGKTANAHHGKVYASNNTYRIEYYPNPPDPRLGTLVGEAVHNLRSALDHLVWEMVLENGGKPNRRTEFPILKVRPGRNSDGTPRMPSASGVSAAALALIDEHQPYRIGEMAEFDALAVLRELSNWDKHRHITVQGQFVDWVSFDQPVTHDFEWVTRQKLDSPDTHIDVWLLPIDRTLEIRGEARLHVVLKEISGTKLSLIGELELAVSRVEGILKKALTVCF